MMSDKANGFKSPGKPESKDSKHGSEDDTPAKPGIR